MVAAYSKLRCLTHDNITLDQSTAILLPTSQWLSLLVRKLATFSESLCLFQNLSLKRTASSSRGDNFQFNSYQGK